MDIAKKREDLINFFKNEDQNYNLEEVLYKEFSVLSFSPREEYIDVVQSDFDHILTPIDFSDPIDMDEAYIKGLIVDIDRKKDYGIIHLFDKKNNISLSVNKNLLNKYDTSLEVGTPVIIKCHTFKQKFYLDFLIDLNHLDAFTTEINYLNGSSLKKLQKLQYDNMAIIKQCTYFVSKKGNHCLRLSLQLYNEERNVISCKNAYNPLPQNLIPGDAIVFDTGNNPNFISNIIKQKWY